MALFKQIFANDPNNPSIVATNGVISIFAPGTRTLIALKTVAGGVLANPIELNSLGFGPAFAADGYTQVAWEAVTPGQTFTGTFESYEGVLEQALAAKAEAAEGAAAELAQRIEAGQFNGADGQDGADGKDGANVATTRQAVADELGDPDSPGRAVLSATIGMQLKPRGEDQNTLGIPTDGVSDCWAALSAIPAGTGRVHLNGIFRVSKKLVMQSGVRFVGTDRTKTIIEAGPNFVGQAVVQLGTENVTFDTGLEHLAVDAKGRADIGVTALNIQELCGLDHAIVTNWLLGGIDFSAGQNQNYDIRTTELYGSIDNVKDNSYGLKTGPGRGRILESITAIPAGAVNLAAPANSAGIILQSPATILQGVHVESCTIGVDLNGATGSLISGISGLPNVDTLVRVRDVGQDNIKIQGLFPQGARLALDDQLHGYTYAFPLSNYEWGSGQTGQEPLSTTANGASQRFVGKTQFIGETIIGSGTWQNPLKLGGYWHLWVDANSKLRLGGGTPAGDFEGVIVGTQA